MSHFCAYALAGSSGASAFALALPAEHRRSAAAIRGGRLELALATLAHDFLLHGHACCKCAQLLLTLHALTKLLVCCVLAAAQQG